MLIQIKDVDEWSSADFIRYIKSQCNIHGIEYTADTKQSYMILGRTFKLLKLNNKSKGWLKKQIDLFVSNETLKEVTSLLFINYLTRTFPRKLEKDTVINLPKQTTVSSKTKKRLVMLRSIFNA